MKQRIYNLTIGLTEQEVVNLEATLKGSDFQWMINDLNKQIDEKCK